ncbi:sensor histidine kinase [Peptoniphilus mikwangii]|uniref:sensor histidine kinase n=1 Tax=Peptoniphilus mikwangii TaxID=1354300 RepID=UPI000406C32E|nr:HAMP domain-containing sensor histidine kinase [Peptoniphilus mikwangii]
MNSIKYYLKSLLKFFIIIFLFFIASLFLFIFGVYYNYQKFNKSDIEPLSVYYMIEENGKLNLSDKNKEFLDKNNLWIMVISSNGKIKENYNLPKHLNRDYSIQDIIKFTRWYLDGYPVFTFVLDEGILVIGYPHGVYEKFPTNFYQYDLFANILKLIFIVFLFDISALFLVYIYSKKKIIDEVYPIATSIKNLSENKSINLPENGNLIEIKQALNKTSKLMKNNSSQREFWIRGISHDLRTPLTKTIGYSYLLEKRIGKCEEIEIIKQNSELMQNIISGLNLTYTLENSIFEYGFENTDIKKLLREIIVDLINTSSTFFEIKFNPNDQEYKINCNKNLIERAIRNILLNSIIHNDNVIITVSLNKIDDNVEIIIKDNGSISKQKITALNLKTENQDVHGLGILITKKIIVLHGGTINFYYNNPGLKTEIKLKKGL